MRLLCGLARGDLPVSFRWLKDGRPLRPLPQDRADRRVTVAEVDAFSSLLTFPRLGEVHTGNYSCLAENDAGSDSHTVSLLVRGRRDLGGGGELCVLGGRGRKQAA